MTNRCPFQMSPVFSKLAMVLKYFFLKDCSQNTYVLMLILTLFNAVLSKQLFSGALSFLPVKCPEYLTSFISFTCIILIYQRITASFSLPKFFTKYFVQCQHTGCEKRSLWLNKFGKYYIKKSLSSSFFKTI